MVQILLGERFVVRIRQQKGHNRELLQEQDQLLLLRFIKEIAY
jgi:hypothetical protein